jgi:hypothetical protein
MDNSVFWAHFSASTSNVDIIEWKDITDGKATCRLHRKLPNEHTVLRKLTLNYKSRLPVSSSEFDLLGTGFLKCNSVKTTFRIQIMGGGGRYFLLYRKRLLKVHPGDDGFSKVFFKANDLRSFKE